VWAGVDGADSPPDVDKSVSHRGFRDTQQVGYTTSDTNVNGRRKSMKGPASRFLDMAWVLLVAAPLLVAAEVAPAQTYAVTTKPNVEYVMHEGVKLTGDFYLPKGLDKAPVIVAVPGGG
jgi:predicted acyl esterase